MCKKGGFRCANHLSTKIKKLEKIENRSMEEDSQLREMKYAYYGTRTGQKELDASIEKAQLQGDEERAEKLAKTKTIASLMREAEAKEIEEKQRKEEQSKDKDNQVSKLSHGFDMDKAEPQNFDNEIVKVSQEYELKKRDMQTFYNSEIQNTYNKQVLVRNGISSSYEWEKTQQETLEEMRKDDSARGQKIRKEFNKHRQELKDYENTLQKLDDKFDERGKWNRAFLATSGGDGHVHKSTGCSTCNKGKTPTQFQWMTNYSGSSEQNIVSDAGYRACTVCYPSAPVGNEKTLPTKMFSDEEKDKQTQKEVRQKAKVEKEQKAQSNAPTLSGEPLKVGSEKFKTERSAVLAYNDKVMDYMMDKAETDAEYKFNPQYIERQREESFLIIKSLAEKRDISIKELQEEMRPKIEAKIKKHNKDRLKPTNLEIMNNIEHRDGPEIKYEADNFGLSEEQYNMSPRLWK